LRGVGTTIEGCKFNPLFFEFYQDIAWNPLPDLKEWFKNYSVYRYGKEDSNLIQAMQIIGETLYCTPFVGEEND
jgi:alpha-N-acetylglucosaminidase